MDSPARISAAAARGASAEAGRLIGQSVEQDGQLLGKRPSAGGDAERRGEPCPGTCLPFVKHPLGQGPGGLDEGHVVEDVEGLEGRVGPHLADDAGLAAGGVEGDHRRRGDRPLPERVEPTAVEVGAVILDVIGVGQLVPQPGRLVRPHRGAADVAPTSSPPRCNAWSRIISAESRSRWACASSRLSGSRRFASGVTRDDCRYVRARDDQAEHGLHVPARSDELGRQPVEQLRMAGRLALGAEVLDRLHQPGAEEHLPDAVHRHAGRQRIGRVDQPSGECQPVGLRRLQRRRIAPRDAGDRLGRPACRTGRGSGRASGAGPASPA